MFEEKKG